MNRFLILAAAGCAFAAVPAQAASLITVDFKIVITRVSGTTKTYELPLTFTYRASFSPDPLGVVDIGPYTSTYFVSGSNDAISSDVFSLLPPLAQTAVPYQSVSGRENDYADVFIRQVSFSDTRYYDAAGKLGQTVSEMFFQNGGPSKGGTGSADNEVTLGEISDILFVGATGSFFVFDRIYDDAGTRTTFEGTSTVTAINGVPEPSTWTLMLAGFGMLGYSLRRRRVRLHAVTAAT